MAFEDVVEDDEIIDFVKETSESDILGAPDYEGGMDPDEAICDLSHPLISLVETSMTLPEFKILNAYLGKIDPTDPTKRHVRFSKGEFEEIIGVDKINKDDMLERLEHMFQPVTIHDNSVKEGYITLSLFDVARAVKDKDGFWQIDLICGSAANHYIFNVQNIGYIRYCLSNVLNLTSRYSLCMFLYINQQLTMHSTWSVSIKQLRKILNCTAKTYDEYKHFNNLVLKKCCAEVNDKTAVGFTYTSTYDENRKVSGIQFNAWRKEIPDDPLNSPKKQLMDKIMDIVSVNGEPYFNRHDMNRVFNIVQNCESEGEALNILQDSFNDFISRLDEQDNNGNIENQPAYFFSVFENQYRQKFAC